MKLTVVIPVYNTQTTLKRCVESVLVSPSEDIEIMLVDDESPDGSAVICDQLAADNKNVSAFHIPHSGLSGARNFAVEKADSEWITFLDSDDEVAPGTYTSLLQILRQNSKAHIVEYPICIGYGTDENQHMLKFKECDYENWEAYWIGQKAYRHCYSCNKIFRRDILLSYPFKQGAKFEDVELMCRIATSACSIHTTHTGLYLYHSNADGITHKATGEDLESILEYNLPLLEQYQDASYYASILNIVLDVYRMTGKIAPIPTQKHYATLKLCFASLFGIRWLCKTHEFITRIIKP